MNGRTTAGKGRARRGRRRGGQGAGAVDEDRRAATRRVSITLDSAGGRRRRPSGEPSPLPRDPLAGFGKVWLVLVALLAVLLVVLLSPSTFFLASGAWWNEFDHEILEGFAAVRVDWLTDVARGLDALRSDLLLTVLRWSTIVVLVAVKRWRHLAVFVTVVLGAEVVGAGLSRRMARVRPDGIEILADWTGFSFPSLPFLALTVTLISMVYALAVPGTVRTNSLRFASVLITLVGLARVYLGVDRVTDVLGAGIIAVAIPVLAFRSVVPDAVYPVTYRRVKTAHLDMTGARRQAIFEGVRDQLGIDVVDLELFGAEGSGGSTPLRLRLSDGGCVFAKLYAQNHLRSDRWYKLGRTLLYGAMEDEAPYRTVRRLAEHEDHMMRLMVAAGVPTPEPLGVVEITTGREYLIVTEFIDGAAEVGEIDIDEATVRSGMQGVRSMWDAGLAHRDVKPANILVKDHTVYLIDHAFGEIRPTPWRQAADLANMMLTMSLGMEPAAVHRLASDYFSADEIGEAFAVARGVTIPAGLRSAMKGSGSEILEENRALAPHREPIGIQRWTRRRILAISILAATAVFIIRLAVLNREIASGLL